MESFYFTFGQSHTTKAGKRLKDYWVRVVADNDMDARVLFIDKFAAKALPRPTQWAFQYTEEHFKETKFRYPKGEYYCVDGTEAELPKPSPLPTALEMITAIANHSGNKSCREKCRAILDGKTTIEEELKYSGSFLTAVFKGDFEDAVGRADLQNLAALETLTF